MKILPIRQGKFRRRPPTKEILIAISLMFSVALTELHAYVLSIFPKTMNMEVDYFLSPKFKMNLRLLWYLKMNTEDLLRLNMFVILILLAPSRFLLYIFCIYFGYFLIDSFLFIWNFKESAEIYRWLLIASVLTILIIFGKLKY